MQRLSTIDGSFTYNVAIGLISHQEWNQWLTRLKWRVINLDYNDVSTLLRTQRIIYTWENHWRYNQEWIIQRHWQQWVHNTKQTNKKTQPTKKKTWATLIRPKTGCEPMCSRRISCLLYIEYCEVSILCWTTKKSLLYCDHCWINWIKSYFTIDVLKVKINI